MKTQKSKTFFLSNEETNNLLGREKAMDYLIDLIKRDINMYLYMDIVPRLGLPKDGNYSISPDRKSLEVTPEEPKIFTGKENDGKN